MVGEGIVFDEPLSTQFRSRSLEVDQQDGVVAYGLEPIKYDELSNEKTEEGADDIEHEDVSSYLWTFLLVSAKKMKSAAAYCVLYSKDVLVILCEHAH